MKATCLLTTLVFFALSAAAQTSVTVKYYKSDDNYKEVPKEKAVVMETTTTYGNGEVTTERRNIKTGQLISSHGYRGDEPVGIWKKRYGGQLTELDYDFELVYKEENCTDTALKHIPDLLTDADSLNYVAPKLPDGKTMFRFLADEVMYPEMPRDNDIQGKVLVNFVVNGQGGVDNVSIRRGTHVALDKEAMRVARKLRFINPPMLDGKPIGFCMVFPLVFKLQ